jgi:hypothetical protein
MGAAMQHKRQAHVALSQQRGRDAVNLRVLCFFGRR